jgi:hypothetical protein
VTWSKVHLAIEETSLETQTLQVLWQNPLLCIALLCRVAGEVRKQALVKSQPHHWLSWVTWVSYLNEIIRQPSSQCRVRVKWVNTRKDLTTVSVTLFGSPETPVDVNYSYILDVNDLNCSTTVHLFRQVLWQFSGQFNGRRCGLGFVPYIFLTAFFIKQNNKTKIYTGMKFYVKKIPTSKLVIVKWKYKD